MYNKKYNSTNRYLEPRDDLFCPFCHKQNKNLNSYDQHRIRCKFNPDRIKIVSHIPLKDNLSNRGWSKGLTKETDVRIANRSKSLQASNRTRPSGKASTEEAEIERRKKISASMKRNPHAGGIRQGSGRGKKGWYKNYFCDSTYELVYVIYNIDHNIKFERCTLVYEYLYNDKIHLYHPDFILQDGSLVEIKGYHTAEVEAKINSVKDRPIRVLYEKDLHYAFEYVKENYSYNELTDLYTPVEL